MPCRAGRSIAHISSGSRLLDPLFSIILLVNSQSPDFFSPSSRLEYWGLELDAIDANDARSATSVCSTLTQLQGHPAATKQDSLSGSSPQAMMKHRDAAP